MVAREQRRSYGEKLLIAPIITKTGRENKSSAKVFVPLISH